MVNFKMMGQGIDKLIESIIKEIEFGKIKYDSRVGNTYYFVGDEKEVCYSVFLESISVARFTKTGKEWLLYIDRNNVDNKFAIFSEYMFNNLLEIILHVVMTDEEMSRLEGELSKLVDEENFEEASKLRDIINNIKIILNI